MRLLKMYLKASPLGFLCALLLGIISGVAGAALISRINSAMAGNAGASAVFMFVLLAAVRVIGGYGSHLWIHALTALTLFELRMKLTRQILATPLRKLEQLGPSKLVAMLTEDVVSLNQGGFGMAVVISYFALIAACLGYLATLSLATTLVVIVALGISAVGQSFLNANGIRLMMKNRLRLNAVFEGLRGITEGAKELMLHPARREAFIREEIRDPSLECRKRSNIIGALFQGSSEFQWTVYTTIIGILLFAFPHSVPAPVATSTIITLLYIQGALNAISESLPLVHRAETALALLDTVGLSLHVEVPLDALAAAPQVWKNLELKGVRHTYRSEDEEDGVFVLGPIDLSLKAGEIVFLVGGNGSGKSTLAKVLCGFYEPEVGELVVDGESVVTPEAQEAHRQRFSAVFSDWHLFDRLYGLDATGETAKRYIKELRLDKKVKLDGKGAFSTTSLSQGQRKRLMLLTAYLEDRPIYLFDEWAADQDPVFKKVFYTEILPNLKKRGKAVFVITHDDSYFNIADRVVRLESGKIVEGVTSLFPPAAAAS